MCIKQFHKYHCNHEKITWFHCGKATPKQRELDEPCQSQTIDKPPVPIDRDNCCSTKCCQDDIDRKTEDLEDVEALWGLNEGQAWGSRRNADLDPAEAPKVLRGGLKKYLVRAVRHHCLRCLQCYNGKNFTRNLDRLRSGELLYKPQPSKIPDRGDLDAYNLDRDELLKAIEIWKTYKPVLRDAELFKQALQSRVPDSTTSAQNNQMMGSPQVVATSFTNRVLREDQLSKIHKSFADMLQKQNYAPKLPRLLTVLMDLRDHMDNVFPLGPNLYCHDIEYAMQKHRYHLCRFQLSEVRRFMEKEYSLGNVDRLVYNNWWPVIGYVRLRIGQLLTGLRDWIKDRPAAFVYWLGRFDYNASLYKDAKKRYLDSPNYHSDRQHHISCSPSSYDLSSARIPNNARRAGANLVDLSEEPEQMQSNSDNDRLERRRRQRRRGEQSVEGSMSSISLDDRPPAKKKAKDKREDEDTSARSSFC